jgi:hypothetical protein
VAAEPLLWLASLLHSAVNYRILGQLLHACSKLPITSNLLHACSKLAMGTINATTRSLCAIWHAQDCTKTANLWCPMALAGHKRYSSVCGAPCQCPNTKHHQHMLPEHKSECHEKLLLLLPFVHHYSVRESDVHALPAAFMNMMPRQVGLHTACLIR